MRIKAATEYRKSRTMERERNTMYIYKNRYQASKDKKADEKIIKVCGGYVLMTADQYRVWRKQR